MTIIYLNDTDTVLYAPNNEATAAESITLTQENGCADQLEITIQESNAQYNNVELNNFILINDRLGVNAFCGVVVNIERSIFGTKKIIAISAETLLDRVIIPLYKSSTEIDATTYFDKFKSFVNESLPNVFDWQYTFTAPDDKLAPMEHDWTSALNVLHQLRELNEDLRIRTRLVLGKPTIWIGKSSPSYIGGITFGANMLEYTDNFSLDEIITSVVPIGAQIGTYADGAPQYRYTDNASMTYPFSASDMAYARIDNSDLPDLITNYGRKTVVVKFDTVTSSALLISRATQWLKDNSFAKLNMTVTGLDLQALTSETYVPNFSAAGNLINITCSPLGIKTDLILQRQTVDILHPEQSKITLSGSKQLSFTQQVQKQFGG